MLMIKKAILNVVLIVGTSSAAMAQSPPWCSSGGLNASERMICTDGILGRLDLTLNDVYREALRVDPNLDQASWLAQRDECGISVSCLESAYR